MSIPQGCATDPGISSAADMHIFIMISLTSEWFLPTIPAPKKWENHETSDIPNPCATGDGLVFNVGWKAAASHVTLPQVTTGYHITTCHNHGCPQAWRSLRYALCIVLLRPVLSRIWNRDRPKNGEIYLPKAFVIKRGWLQNPLWLEYFQLRRLISRGLIKHSRS